MNTTIFSEIAWGSHYRAPSLLIIVIAIGLILFQYHKRSKAYSLLHATNFSHAQTNFWRRLAKTVAALLGFVFLFITLMRPCWGKKEEELRHEGRELFIALDASRSMLAQDLPLSRLETAKEKIKKLLELLKSERVGLILFSETALVQCPLTTDWSAFRLFLDHVDAQTISAGTTACENAIKKALDAFKGAGAAQNKILVLFTDGEDFSTDLALIKQEATAANLHIFTVGVGTEQGAPVPVINAEGETIGHQKDEQGAVVISKLNEEMLKTLAHDSGGIFIPLTETDDDLYSIKKQVEQYEKEYLESQRLEQLSERYYITAALSFLFFLIEWLL